MKIQIVSDLHLEFGDIEINNKGADVLVLSGDITVAEYLHDIGADFNPYESGALTKLTRKMETAMRTREFFKRVSQEFEQVVYVAGNHEHYHGKWGAAHTYLEELVAPFDNVAYLNRSLIVHKGVTFVGGTLWTDMNRHDPLTLHAVQDMLNDFQVIRNDLLGYTKLKPATVAVQHRHTVDYFKVAVRDLKDDKVVVVTHHAPSFRSVHQHYKNETLMNGAYASDLSEFILDNPQIKLWTHGHMHDPSDYMIGETRIVCHPRGYANTSESFGFDGGKVVEI